MKTKEEQPPMKTRSRRKLNAVDMKIAEARAAGFPMGQIGTMVGVGKSTVQRRLQNPELKEAIEKIGAELLSCCVRTAADNIKYAIESYRAPWIKEDSQLREHGFKASQRLLESIGIFPSHTIGHFPADHQRSRRRHQF
jgi:hypothetical protein